MIHHANCPSHDGRAYDHNQQLDSSNLLVEEVQVIFPVGQICRLMTGIFAFAHLDGSSLNKHGRRSRAALDWSLFFDGFYVY